MQRSVFGRSAPPAAELLTPLVNELAGGDREFAVRCWDGSVAGPAEAPVTIVVRSPAALRRMVWAPGELGVARAFVAGDVDVRGDIEELAPSVPSIEHAGDAWARGRAYARLLGAAFRLGAIGTPPPRPAEEHRGHGLLHSRGRDADAVSYHYDVSNEFYELVLGRTMTYSCAYYRDPGLSLDDAQTAKYELVCRKLGLVPGQRLLDVGCGWGGMLLHAAGTHQVHATGVTTSRSQAELASRRVAVAALTDRIEVRLADYRDLRGERFDAISSIGMFEHVGKKRLTEYLERLYELLRPGGRLLNHGISRPGPGPRMSRSFIQRYVFPDGELQRIGDVTTAMEDVGFEVRDVESLREHYAKTLRAWVRRLDERWEDAVRLVGDARARTWRLYMSGSAAAFTRGRISVHQILAVRPDEHGRSHFPTTRAAWSAGRTVDGDTRTPLDLTPAAFG